MTATAVAGPVLASIPVDLIERNPHNPRRDETPTPELVQSVREHGVVVPIIVRPDGDRYQLIAGHRRLAAARQTDITEIPAVVRAEADLAAMELTLIENLHRKDLSPLEEADGYYTLVQLGLTQKQIADKLGVSQPLVSKRLKLLILPDVARRAVERGRDDGGITIEEAVALGALPDKEIEGLFRGGRAPAPHQVREAVRQHVEAKRRQKVVDELKAAGVKVTTERPGWNAEHPPCRLSYLEVDVDEDDHAAMECHVVYVNERGDTAACCITPENHSAPEPPPGPVAGKPAMAAAKPKPAPERPAEPAEVDAERQRRHIVEEDRERRLAFCRDLIGRPCTNDIVALAAHVLPEVGEIGLPAALDLLGVVAGDWDEQIRQMQEYAGDDCRTQVQALYAMVLAGAEGFTIEAYRELARGDDAPDGYLPVTRRYIKHLVANGYDLSDVEGELVAEQLTIDEGAPEPAPQLAEDLTDEEYERHAARLSAGISADEDAGVGRDPAGGAPDADHDHEVPAPTFTVAAKGKRFLASCSACGPLSKVGNTTDSYARLAGINHLFSEHGIAS
jgi:ParB/RepB/Spo0J family partition protein